MKAFVPFLCCLVVVLSATARADIYRWDKSQLIKGTEGITPGPGVVLDHHELAFAALLERNLTSARFDVSNLTSARLGGSTLTSANQSGANLTAADLDGSTLTNANLSFADWPARQFISAMSEKSVAPTSHYRSEARGCRYPRAEGDTRSLCASRCYEIPGNAASVREMHGRDSLKPPK